MRIAALLVFVLLSNGCGIASRLMGSGGVDSQTSDSVRNNFKDKRFIALVYEGIPRKDLGVDNVLRFQQSALLDEALVDLKQKVSDRGPIQSILEKQRLPESGSFKGEDLLNIGKASGADVLILGYYTTTPREGLLTTHQDQKMILRAINLQTLEVINSVQSDKFSDGEWKHMTRVLFRAS